jgi:hypothetical protein
MTVKLRDPVAEPGGRKDSSAGRTRTAARARLPGGRVLLARSVAGSARLTRLASLLLHALARSIAGSSRLTFNRALVLHTLPWRAILRRALCRAHHGHREQQAASGCNRKNFIPHLSSLHWRLRGNSAITRCAAAQFPGSKRARDGHHRRTIILRVYEIAQFALRELAVGDGAREMVAQLARGDRLCLTDPIGVAAAGGQALIASRA